MQEDENQLQGVEAGKQQISQRLAQLKVCACGGGCVCVWVCVCECCICVLCEQEQISERLVS